VAGLGIVADFLSFEQKKFDQSPEILECLTLFTATVVEKKG
jgi:hypothetical protein